MYYALVKYCLMQLYGNHPESSLRQTRNWNKSGHWSVWLCLSGILALPAMLFYVRFCRERRVLCVLIHNLNTMQVFTMCTSFLIRRKKVFCQRFTVSPSVIDNTQSFMAMVYHCYRRQAEVITPGKIRRKESCKCLHFCLFHFLMLLAFCLFLIVINGLPQ